MRAEAPAPTAWLDRINAVPRLGIGQFPTPLDTRTLPGERIVHIKRDDRCGHGRGGVKARKIDFFLRDFVDRRRDHLVTLVTNVTNLAHDLAPLLRDFQIRSTFFVTDDPPMPLSLRARLFEDLGDDVRFLGRARATVAMRVVAATAAARLGGRRPGIALPSIGHPASVVGVARGFLEMAEQMKASCGRLPSTVFITAASGVTLAGLALGERILRQSGESRIRIIGVPVYSGPVLLYARMLLRWSSRWLHLGESIELDTVELANRTGQYEFGYFDSSLAALCERVKAEQDLDIDPIYGGKTWATMEQMIAANEVELPCVYWHCGNTPDWRSFPQEDAQR